MNQKTESRRPKTEDGRPKSVPAEVLRNPGLFIRLIALCAMLSALCAAGCLSPQPAADRYPWRGPVVAPDGTKLDPQWCPRTNAVPSSADSKGSRK